MPQRRGLSTPAVYREFDRLHPDARPAHVERPAGVLIAALDGGDPTRLAAALRNDLEDAALSLRPELATGSRWCGSTARTVTALRVGSDALGLARPRRSAPETRAALLEPAAPSVHVATGPVAGAHVVEYLRAMALPTC